MSWIVRTQRLNYRGLHYVTMSQIVDHTRGQNNLHHEMEIMPTSVGGDSTKIIDSMNEKLTVAVRKTMKNKRSSDLLIACHSEAFSYNLGWWSSLSRWLVSILSSSKLSSLWFMLCSANNTLSFDPGVSVEIASQWRGTTVLSDVIPSSSRCCVELPQRATAGDERSTNSGSSKVEWTSWEVGTEVGVPRTVTGTRSTDGMQMLRFGISHEMERSALRLGFVALATGDAVWGRLDGVRWLNLSVLLVRNEQARCSIARRRSQAGAWRLGSLWRTPNTMIVHTTDAADRNMTLMT